MQYFVKGSCCSVAHILGRVLRCCFELEVLLLLYARIHPFTCNHELYSAFICHVNVYVMWQLVPSTTSSCTTSMHKGGLSSPQVAAPQPWALRPPQDSGMVWRRLGAGCTSMGAAEDRTAGSVRFQVRGNTSALAARFVPTSWSSHCGRQCTIGQTAAGTWQGINPLRFMPRQQLADQATTAIDEPSCSLSLFCSTIVTVCVARR